MSTKKHSPANAVPNDAARPHASPTPPSFTASMLDPVLGPDAARLPPDLAERVAIALAEAASAPDGNAEPAFFEFMERGQGWLRSSQGESWEGFHGCIGLSIKLRDVDIALSGLDGVLEVVAAGEYARYSDTPERALGDNLTDRLMHATRALVGMARAQLEDARVIGIKGGKHESR